ncbi:MAG: hypothetical protein ACI9FU_000664 [Granulosicoccus sp.]|jgi:hypothetical protein
MVKNVSAFNLNWIMIKTLLKRSIQCIAIFTVWLGLAFQSQSQAQTCNVTANDGTACTPRSEAYYGELVPSAGETFVSSGAYGPGEYFRMPVLSGGCYTVSTCGASVDTQIMLYQGDSTTTPFAYNDDDGPVCNGLQSSITYSPSFTDYTRVDVRQFNCLPGGSASIIVNVRQNNNLAFTSSSNSLCSGESVYLTATPAPVTGAQINSGNSGTFSGTGVQYGLGVYFVAPVPSGASEDFTITYTFGYLSTTQVITVYAWPSTANAGSDQTVCASSTNLDATAPTFGVGTWSVVSGPGIVAAPSIINSTITNLSFVTPTVVHWSVSHGPCTVSISEVTITRLDATLPVISCPGTQYAAVDSFCANSLADYTGFATASDDCGAVNIVQVPAPGTVILGTTAVNLFASDAAGNSSMCEFIVKLAPTITHFSSRTEDQWRVNWEYSAATPNDTNFRIRYWEQGFAGAFTDRSQFPGDFQKKIIGLEDNTWYDVEIGFACANGGFIWSDTESVRTKKMVCSKPLGLDQDLPILDNMATVSWDDQGATSYKFRYQEVGTSVWNYSTVSSPAKTVSGLSIGNAYTYQIKALCENGLWSSYTLADVFATTAIEDDESSARLAASDLASEFKMSLYPNPSSGEFNIELEGRLSNVNIEVRDITGSVIRVIELGDRDAARLDLSDLDSGVYLLQATQNGERLATERLLLD